MAIKLTHSDLTSLDSVDLNKDVYKDTKSRQTAAKDIQGAYRIKRSKSAQHDTHLYQTYAMLDRALSEAQSQKEVCKTKQHVNDDITYTMSSDSELDSKCCEGSRCGLSDDMHEILIHSGKWFYDCFGPPKSKSAAEDIVTVAEFGEEGAMFCCCIKTRSKERKNTKTDPGDSEMQKI